MTGFSFLDMSLLFHPEKYYCLNDTEVIASRYTSELVGNQRCVKLVDLLQMLKQNKKWPS